MATADQDTSVVNRLGKTELEDLGLEAALEEVVDLEAQNVIELLLGLVEHTNADETANQGVTLEQTLGALVLKGEQLTGGLADLGKGEGDPVDLNSLNKEKERKSIKFSPILIIWSWRMHMHNKNCVQKFLKRS